MAGTDARDWVRGRRPWSQFLNYCDRLGRTSGTDLWAVYLTDPRLDALYREQLAERDPEQVDRLPLAGFDRHAEALLELRKDMAHLIRALGRPGYPLPQGPIFPAERFTTEDQQVEATGLWDSIAQGQQRWKELHA